MYRALFRAVIGLSLLLATTSAKATEVDLSVDTRLGYDSDVFRRIGAGRKADGYWDIAPRVVVSDGSEARNYRLDYRPNFQRFFKFSRASGVDHMLRGNGLWHFNQRDSVSGNVAYRNARRLRLLGVEIPGAAPTDPSTFVQRDDGKLRTQRTTAWGNYNRRITRAWSGNLKYDLDNTNFENDSAVTGRNRLDSEGHSIAAGLTYAISPRTRVGVTGTTRRREVRDDNGPTRTTSLTSDVSFSISHELRPNLRISVQGGPSFVESVQEDGINRNDSNTSFFAAASIAKHWRNGSFSLSYSRFESGSTGLSTSSVVDSVTVSVQHQLDRFWRVAATANWNQREQLTQFGFSDEKADGIWTVWTLSRKISSELTVTGRFTYRTRDTETSSVIVALNQSASTELYAGALILRYEFDSVKF